MGSQIEKVLIFGSGYVATALTEVLVARHIPVIVTTRSDNTHLYINSLGATPLKFGEPLPSVSHALQTAPPYNGEDPVLETYKDKLFPWSEDLKWFGYLSTTGVYGDAAGAEVSEESPLNPTSERAKARMLAEMGYLNSDLPAHIFRLSGIYGPERSAIDRLKAGRVTRQPVDDDPVNRIHVDDIVQVLLASMEKPNPGAIYNLADDAPAPTKEVYAFAAAQSNMVDTYTALPKAEPKENGPMGDGSRKVSNQKIKQELGVELKYPTYREGLMSTS